MFLFLVVISLLFIDGAVCELDEEDDDTQFALLYLRHYHYLSPETSSNTNTTEAIENFQKFFGLTVTGELDDDTMYEMKKPRCGDPDVDTDGLRLKRYATVGRQWSNTTLTYSFSPGADMKNKDQLRIIARAFKYWSDAAPKLTFTRTNNFNKSDIRISFGKLAHSGVPGERQCPYDFDGQGGVIAHAYYPTEGRIHFDDDEHYTEFGGSVVGWWWNKRQTRGLLYTAVHEIGHALGLKHSDVKDAVMWPLAKNGNPKLDQDDIDGIISLYGKCIN